MAKETNFANATTMTMAQFEVLIGQVKRLGKLTDNAIQRAAIFAVACSRVKGEEGSFECSDSNATPARTLLAAMPNGSRKVSVVAFLEFYGNLAYMKREKTFQFFDVEEMTGKALDPIKPENMPMWYQFGPKDDPTSAWDVEEQLSKLVKRMKKALENDEREVLHPELLEKIQAVLRQHTIDQALKEALDA